MLGKTSLLNKRFSLALIACFFAVGACSSNPYRNEAFEESHEVWVDISNAHIAQRDIDAFAKFSFKKSDFLKALEHTIEYTQKSGQHKIWKDSLIPLKKQIESLQRPGHYQMDQGFHGRMSTVNWLIENEHGTVCCDQQKKSFPVEELKLEKPSELQKKAHALFTAAPMRYEKYYKLSSGDRIWPWLPLKQNAHGQ